MIYVSTTQLCRIGRQKARALCSAQAARIFLIGCVYTVAFIKALRILCPVATRRRRFCGRKREHENLSRRSFAPNLSAPKFLARLSARELERKGRVMTIFGVALLS